MSATTTKHPSDLNFWPPLRNMSSRKRPPFHPPADKTKLKPLLPSDEIEADIVKSQHVLSEDPKQFVSVRHLRHMRRRPRCLFPERTSRPKRELGMGVQLVDRSSKQASKQATTTTKHPELCASLQA